MLRNFSFIEDHLAASARPGLWGSLMEDLEDAAAQGITEIVSLTEKPLSAAMVQEAGLKLHHLPIVDFTPPTQEQFDQFLAIVDRVRAAGGKVLVHCQAGMGRTGTVLAACIALQHGVDARTAIDQVRESRPGSIETPDQEAAVVEYVRRRASAS